MSVPAPAPVLVADGPDALDPSVADAVVVAPAAELLAERLSADSERFSLVVVADPAELVGVAPLVVAFSFAIPIVPLAILSDTVVVAITVVEAVVVVLPMMSVDELATFATLVLSEELGEASAAVVVASVSSADDDADEVALIVIVVVTFPGGVFVAGIVLVAYVVLAVDGALVATVSVASLTPPSAAVVVVLVSVAGCTSYVAARSGADDVAAEVFVEVDNWPAGVGPTASAGGATVTAEEVAAAVSEGWVLVDVSPAANAAAVLFAKIATIRKAAAA